MKNIRSISLKALSLSLLLSPIALNAMDVSQDQYLKGFVERCLSTVATPTVQAVVPAIPAPQAIASVTQPGWYDYARGLVTSAVNGAKSVLASRPHTMEEAKQQASDLAEYAKAHPYITAGAAAASLAATGLTAYGLYKGGQRVLGKEARAQRAAKRAEKAEKALISQIEQAVFLQVEAMKNAFNDFTINGTAKVAGSLKSREFGKTLVPVLKQLLASKPAVVTQAYNFINAIVAFDDAADFNVALVKPVRTAVQAMEKLGLDFTYKPTFKDKVLAAKDTAVANLPSMKTVKNAVIVAGAVATPIAIAKAMNAYDNGAFDGAINAGSNVVASAITKGSNAVNTVVDTVRNADYAGKFAKAQNAVAPVTTPVLNFVGNHKVGTGVAVAGTALGGIAFFNREAIKKQAFERKKAQVLNAQPDAGITNTLLNK